MKSLCCCFLTMSLACLVTNVLCAAEPLGERIDKFIEGDRYRSAHWGILVVDAQTGETLYDHQSHKFFAPASTTKLYTVAAAFDALGAEHRFETNVFAKGDIAEGVLRGDLILRASGDLTMGGRTTPEGEIEFTGGDHTYAGGGPDTVLTKQDPLAGLNELAKQVRVAGIQQVTGEVYVDDWLFDDAESSGSGPTIVSPILINDNVIDVTFAPTKPGEPATVTWRPQSAALTVEVRCETVDAKEKLRTSIQDLGNGKLLVTGKIPADHKPVYDIHAVPDPRRFARQLFIEALERAGVKVDAKLDQDARFASRSKAPNYESLKPVATLVSPPFAENARLVMKVSHNLHASTLPLLLAAKHGKHTLSDGMKLENDFFKKAGLPVNEISFGGGAGGSRADYVSPAATVALLRYMQTRSDFPLYERTLPIMGIDGTLAKTVSPESIAKDKVQAKTGTLFWNSGLDNTGLLTSKALGGFLTTAKGRRLVVALYVNGVKLDNGLTPGKIGEDLGKVCEIIVEEG